MCELKTCTKCGAEKPLEEFRLVKDRGTTYRQGSCRDCFNGYYRNRYANKPGKRLYHVYYELCKKDNGSGVISQEDFNHLLENSPNCYYCKVELGKSIIPHIEHRVPVAKGGSSLKDNLVVACEFCNRAKNDRDEIEFTSWLHGIIERINGTVQT